MLTLLIDRTDIIGRMYARFIIVVQIAIPPYILAMAWQLLAGPKTGILNVLFANVLGISNLFNAFSYTGIIWTLTLFQIPLAYLILRSSLKSIDFALEQQSLTTGASMVRTLRRITLPLLLPSLIASFLLTFAISIEEFTIPLILGTPAHINTLALNIFLDFFVFFPPNYGQAVVSSVVLFAIAGLVMLLYYKVIGREKRFVTVTGKGFQVGIIRLKKWRKTATILLFFFLTFSIILPITIIVLNSFLPVWTGSITGFTFSNYVLVYTEIGFSSAITNSVELAVVTSLLLVGAGLLVSYLLHRTQIPGRKAMDMVITLPIVVPGIIFGLSMYLTWVIHIPLMLVGSLWLLVIAVFSRYLPYAVRTISSGFLSIEKELDQSSLVSGSSPIKTFYRVTFPLMKGNMVGSLLITFANIMRDVSSVLFVYTSTSLVLAPVMLFTWYEESWQTTSAMAVILIAISSIAIVLSEKFGQTSLFGGRS
ncbi:MAG: iron ABC transporter permease [archaeon]|nr:iron ABC transporter permease [archaeon]